MLGEAHLYFCFLLTELIFEDLLKSEHVLKCIPESWHPLFPRKRTVLPSYLWTFLTITEMPHLILQGQYLSFLWGMQVNPDYFLKHPFLRRGNEARTSGRDTLSSSDLEVLQSVKFI